MYRVLLVEDDRSLSYGLIYFLKKEGYSVTHYESIEQTREGIRKKDFDIALLDISLPDGESYDLVEYIRDEKNTPIIFLTAKDTDEDVIKGFDFGADDYITKPFSLRVLDARIKRLLKRINATDNKFRYTGDLTIDMQNLRVIREDSVIDLTHSEYKLLNYFLDNTSRIISREELLELLWDSDADFQSYSTISVYINRLRDKIEINPSNPEYLITKRGTGYYWAMEVR